MHKLTNLALSDAIRLGSELRKLGDGAANMEEAASRVTRYLYNELTDDHGAPATALVRLYKSHPYGALPPPLQRFALGLLGGVTPADDVRCLALLGTCGSVPEWNDRKRSGGHQAIPLPSESAV